MTDLLAPVIEVEGVSKHFGGLVAVADVSFVVEEGQVVSLIGPNGAGKTTMFNLVTGLEKPTQGSIRILGRETQGVRACEIASWSLSRTFQNIRLFADLPVLDNVKVGAHHWSRGGLWDALFRSHRHFVQEQKIAQVAQEALEFVGLSEVQDELAGSLPYGQQRRLEIARALAARPRVLLLDEPAAGLNPRETDQLEELLGRIRNRGITIFLIEHDMKFVMRISDQVLVFDHGACIASGAPEVVRRDPRVIEAYLGVEE
jgi:branched-chain amino acid transport system ATP-binding protein